MEAMVALLLMESHHAIVHSSVHHRSLQIHHGLSSNGSILMIISRGRRPLGLRHRILEKRAIVRLRFRWTVRAIPRGTVHGAIALLHLQRVLGEGVVSGVAQQALHRVRGHGVVLVQPWWWLVV